MMHGSPLLTLLFTTIAISNAIHNEREPQKVCSSAWIYPRGGSLAPESPHIIRKEMESNTDNNTPLCHPSNIPLAARTFSPIHGMTAYRFLKGLASSPTFVNAYWHKKPLFLQGSSNNWISDAFTVDRDLKLIDGSYITGHKTADIMRNGSKTDTWAFTPLKADPACATTWDDIAKAMEGGTIYFNTAGSLWPTLGGLCRLTNAAFGLPANVNIYITPPGQTLSVPPHTDRQDVLVFQTQGAKRWRVYAPPKRSKGVDPLNRGKAGDVLSFEELAEPIIDIVLRKGDCLYVPTGFPHTTDTYIQDEINSNNNNNNNCENQTILPEMAVHLTMGLDTHVWGLTLAHLRWSILQRCDKEHTINIENDDIFWQAMETIPIGFLVPGESWKTTIENIKEGKGLDNTYSQLVMEELKRIMLLLEPKRWTKEDLPTDEDIHQVINYMITQHLQTLMEVQEEMLSDIRPSDEDTLIKAYKCTQQQNAVMEKFGAFSKNDAMKDMFQKRRLEREDRANTLR